ncbi:dihydrofolate reductase [Tardiphaga alba]|uniref:Dihydrofolate reductase n=1 Tax=Tardiphaga alba TaxID=340268 RepID=A0ABX8A7N3_9BRAD|nr:dihydrofolate reductase [Tardiphaga alba]QUS39749.1 dihydrofolate reductase [Tardiphaga alba]
MPITVEGYVIVSADGRLTDATNQQPDALRFKEDHRFFVDGLKRAALVVHGRNSGDGDPRTCVRRRLIVTRSVAAFALADDIPQAVYWNPAGASFEAAADAAGIADGSVAIIGGPAVYGLFLDRYDVFWLSEAHGVHLPDGQGCFPGVPAKSPHEVLASHGLTASETRVLDADNDVTVTAWRRS